MSIGINDNKEENWPTPTREDVESLKRNWKHDPCWDIEDTEGYEGFRQELLTFHQECEAQWEEERKERVNKKADEMGVRPNSAAYKYLSNLEYKIERLESDLEKLTDRLDNICNINNLSTRK